MRPNSRENKRGKQFPQIKDQVVKYCLHGRSKLVERTVTSSWVSKMKKQAKRVAQGRILCLDTRQMLSFEQLYITWRDVLNASPKSLGCSTQSRFHYHKVFKSPWMGTPGRGLDRKVHTVRRQISTIIRRQSFQGALHNWGVTHAAQGGKSTVITVNALIETQRASAIHIRSAAHVQNIHALDGRETAVKSTGDSNHWLGKIIWVQV